MFGPSNSLNLTCAALEVFMEEMRVSNEKFTSYYNSGDMKAVSELYTEDCKAMPQGKEVQEGRKGIIYSRRKEKKRYM